MIRRIVTASAALLIVWLGLLASQPVAAAVPDRAELTYAYDGDHHPVAAATTTTERGPPTYVRELAITRYAVDHWLHGALGCFERPTSRATTTYDDAATLLEVALATGATREQVRRADRKSASSGCAGVAANSVRPSVTDARLGRALADDFRGGPNPIGDGSALDAARHTVDTGQLVGGSTHLEKAVEMRDRYARVLQRGGLSPADEAVAQGRLDAYRSFVVDNDLDAMMRARGLR